MRIMVLEDDKHTLDTVTAALQRQYAVDAFACLAEAEIAAAGNTYDLYLLDVSLPDGCGRTFAEQLRKDGMKSPILLLTADAEEQHKILSFDGGVDDYMTKPFSLAELLARVRALLRRSTPFTGMRVQFGDLAFLLDTYTATCKNSLLVLRKKELVILELLMRAQGNSVTREFLTEHAWDMNAETTSNALDVHIAHIRKALRQTRSSVSIVTKKGLGYFLKNSG